MIREAIRQLSDGGHLRVESARAVTDEIVSCAATPAQSAAYLALLLARGETEEEILGTVLAMKDRAIRVELVQPRAVDTCGTGGDGRGTFNISTTVAFILSAAGVPVAKHGNRSFSSRCGSADVLEELGMNIHLAPREVARSIEQTNFGFIFAPDFHPAMKNVGPIRKEIGIRTIFNLAGPLVNPASPPCQFVGVSRREWLDPFARVLSGMGVSSAAVVHGAGGVDELTLAGLNEVVYVKAGSIFREDIDPAELGFPRAGVETVRGDDPRRNAEIILSVLKGEDSLYRETVLLNAALGLKVSGITEHLATAVTIAEEAIDSGKAYRALKSACEASHDLS